MPSYFRFLTLVGFRLFYEEGVDVLVLETGMGGRLDATNLIPRPFVCGLSLIDYDHMDVLGDTLSLIAREKAGIMKVRGESSPSLASFARNSTAPLCSACPRTRKCKRNCSEEQSSSSAS